MTLDFDVARQNMVDSQVRPNDVTDPQIQNAMRRAPREALCKGAEHLAYADREVQYAPGRWLMRPRDAGKMLQAVRPRDGERALALSAPYLAQVMGLMGLGVNEQDAAAPVSGAYDVIVCEGALAAVPDSWKAALASGGRLCVVERTTGLGRVMLYLRTEEGVSGRPAFESAAPLMSGFEPAPAFSF